MAQFRDFYLPAIDSPEPGAVWRIGYHKPDRGPGVVSAWLGTLREEETYQAFQCDVFGCRKYRHQLPGRATKRAVAQQLAALLSEMRDAGSICSDRADNYIKQALAV